MVSVGKINAAGKADVFFGFAADGGREVSLAGSFNDWDPAACGMPYNPGTRQYECTMQLAPGNYEYKFVVGGKWLLDESNPNFSANDFGTLNSVVAVKAE